MGRLLALATEASYTSLYESRLGGLSYFPIHFLHGWFLVHFFSILPVAVVFYLVVVQQLALPVAQVVQPETLIDVPISPIVDTVAMLFVQHVMALVHLVSSQSPLP